MAFAIWFSTAASTNFTFLLFPGQDENRHDLARAAVAAVFPQLISTDIVIRGELPVKSAARSRKAEIKIFSRDSTV